MGCKQHQTDRQTACTPARHCYMQLIVGSCRLAHFMTTFITNAIVAACRSAAVLHAQSLSTRCRDLYTQLKHCKRELKRTHKTIKTFELMAAAVGGAAQAAAAQAAAQAAATPTKQDAAVQQQQQAQVQPVQQQQQPGSIMTAGVSCSTFTGRRRWLLVAG